LSSLPPFLCVALLTCALPLALSAAMATHLYSEETGAADAVLLHDISEDSFVGNLRLRFAKDIIYTYIGEVLVCVNPYRDLGLYADALLPTFRHKALYQKEPHVYALAEAAYSSMRRLGKDCVVIISGESGAGKTEASKQVMRYVAGVNSSTAQAEILRVRDQLLASNPLLEAFGNAKTVRNDNSSRFGKYMDINFDYKHEPVGGHISNYLLEKARVVKQGAGERNFHIFYQILAGVDDARLASLKLKRDVAGYNYLTQHAAPCEGLDDKAGYGETVEAMQKIGFDDALMQCLHEVVAAVLHLGQLRFEAEGEASKITTKDVLQNVASLLGVDVAELHKALTSRTVAAHGEVYHTKLTQEAATHACLALSKSIYERLFSFLVKRINETIAPGERANDGVVLGVLDIYGFEILPDNSFEQFCINYCNEKLQQVFIELVLQQEQAEYEREGIDWVHIEYFDNAEICNMIDDPKAGMIAMLDEQCALSSGNDKSFLALLDKALAKNARYTSKQTDAANKTCERERDFCIRHFAGDVVYDTNGFVEKNNDSLFHDLSRVLYSSSNQFLQSMWPEGADKITEVHKVPYTAATNFRRSMDSLVAMLKTKTPFYIRCIKPNKEKIASKWDEELCRHQVAYLGLMENLRVRRAGYCNRQPYEIFLERYKMLSKDTWPNWHRDPKDGARKIIDALNMTAEVAFGKTKIFIKEPQSLVRLEEEREAALPRIVSKIQARYRGVLGRRRVRKIRAIYKIIAYWHASHLRGYLNTLCKTFEKAGELPDFGKSLPFPPAPPGLNNFAVTCKRIQMAWRARKIVDRYSKEEQEDLKKKILASDLLGGRRPYWGYACKWEGNYMVKGPAAQKFGAAITPLMEREGDTKVVFSSRIYKLNTKGKQDERILVITDKHLYRLDPKSFKLHKTPVPLEQVTGFSISAGEDQAVVIHLGQDADNDLVVTLRGNACAAELVSLIAQQVDESLPVTVNSKIYYHAQGKELSLTFSEEEAKQTAFKRRGSGYALITRRASVMRFQPEDFPGPSSKRGSELNAISE